MSWSWLVSVGPARRPKPLLLALAFVLLALSGCIGAAEVEVPEETNNEEEVATDGHAIVRMPAPVTGSDEAQDENATRPGGAEIKGNVTSSAGAPLAGVQVIIHQDRGGWVPLQPALVTDENGRYSLFGLHGGHYMVRATNPGFRDAVRAIALSDFEEQSEFLILREAPKDYDRGIRVERHEIEGTLGCQAVVSLLANRVPCDGASDAARAGSVAVGPGAVNVLFAVEWEPTHPTTQEIEVRLDITPPDPDAERCRNRSSVEVLNVERVPGEWDRLDDDNIQNRCGTWKDITTPIELRYRLDPNINELFRMDYPQRNQPFTIHVEVWYNALAPQNTDPFSSEDDGCNTCL